MPTRRLVRSSGASLLLSGLALFASTASAQSISLLDARVVEDDSGTSALVFEARLSAPSGADVSFNFATSNGTAIAGSDYNAQSLTHLVIPAGQTSLKFPVAVVSDTIEEPNVFLNASISSVVGATVADGNATGLIVDNDGPINISAPHNPASAPNGSTGTAQDRPAISQDGRFVAFVSDGNDLSEGQPANNFKDVFVRDTRTGVTRLVSVGVNGVAANGESMNPAISADGRYIAFESAASNLVASDGNGGTRDIFVRDMQAGATTLESRGTSTTTANGDSGNPYISGDGSYIVFTSVATDLVNSDSNGATSDVFLRERGVSTALMSRATDGVSSGNAASSGGRISADGRWLVYSSQASNLVANDGNGFSDVFLRGLWGGPTVRISTASGGGDSNGASAQAAISADGRYIAYSSTATNLGAPSRPSSLQSYVRDMQQGTVRLATYAADNINPTATQAGVFGISGDGRYVLFQTPDPDVLGDNNGGVGADDVFVRDMQANVSYRLSYRPGGNDTQFASLVPVISGDGRYVAFVAADPQVYRGDANAKLDVVRVMVPADPFPPSIEINDTWVTEGDGGTKQLNLSVSLTSMPSTPVTFDLDTVDGTAVGSEPAEPWSDYGILHERGLSIGPGEVSKTISIDITGDTLVEGDEHFDVYLGNVVGAKTRDGHGMVIIGNNDSGASLPSMSVAQVSMTEGNSGTKLMNFTVQLSWAASAPVSFDVATSDITALSGDDYVGIALTGQTIPAGQTSKTISVEIVGDTQVESQESFMLTLNNASGATLQVGQSSAQGVIENDDAAGPTLSINDLTLTEGNSGTKLATFTITLSAAQPGPVFVDVATGNGSATAGVDFVAKSTTGMRFAAGTTSKTFAVTINGDTNFEPDENFGVILSNPVGATVFDNAGIATILNDDIDPPPVLTIDDASVVEGNSPSDPPFAFVYVHLSKPSATPVTFDIASANGTATAGSDYTAVSLTGLSIPSGQTELMVAVQPIHDSVVEPDETLSLNVSNVVGATVGDGQATVTLLNDDVAAQPLTASIADISLVEGSGTRTVAVTVTLSAPATSTVMVPLSAVDGTAVTEADYFFIPYVVVISAGQSSGTANMTICGDTIGEPIETFTINMGAVTGATIGKGTATVSITDDDGPLVPTLVVSDVSVTEGNSGTKVANFVVSLSALPGGPVSFAAATSDGTAVSPSDYTGFGFTIVSVPLGQTSVVVPVTIIGDTAQEGDETFALKLQSVQGANLRDGNATGTITNDDSAGGPKFSVNDVTIAEGNSGTKTASFTITLSAPQSGPTFVDVATANGTATAGSDYVAKTTAGLRFSAGATSKAFVVTINGDTSSEPDEGFTVNLSNPVGATIADGVGQGTITNDDAAATPTLSIADASVTEGNSGTKLLNFTVSLTPAAAGPVTFDVTSANGSAVASGDYVAIALAGQVIPAGATSKIVSVTINGDNTNEADENFQVILSNASVPIGDGFATGTIINDDSGGGGPTLSIADVALAEGNTLSKQMTFTVTLSAPASTAVTYSIATADGTAIAPGDYTAKSQAGVSIPAGSTSKTFAVAIKGDRTFEPNETFLVNVTGVSGAALGDGQAVGTITNDDAAALTVARFDARGLVDDVDDGNREPQVAPTEYASLLLDSATQLCRRAPGATVIAVDGVEHRQLLAELADTLSATCDKAPRYAAVMADGDRRGFLVEMSTQASVAPAEVLGQPVADIDANSTMLVLQGVGHERPLAIVVASTSQGNRREREAQDQALEAKLKSIAREQPGMGVVLLGGRKASGLVDLTARDFPRDASPKRGVPVLPAERVLVNQALLRSEAGAHVDRVPLATGEAPAQVMRLP